MRSLTEPVAGLAAARRQAATLRETGHRPWPLPDGPWVMGQTWEDLLFAHWRVPADALRAVIPEALPIDEFEGSAWLGITPFEVRALRPRLLPPPAAGSRFPELNVRTYVTVGGKPGIWFFSLDAASRLAVAGARRAFRLPYFHADMAITRSGDRIEYRSERRSPDGPPAAFAGEYGPTGPAAIARPGTLEHFLTERYCLYTFDARLRVHRADIHHPPWPLQPASATLRRNTMTHQIGLDVDDGDPVLHFARRQDVVVWARRPV